ncbi:MAG: hypothetical protein EOP82_32460 [Variovorax sp.]|nr:MAG: hypothetical protein EOP82_32460 [Variovorax sp.]
MTKPRTPSAEPEGEIFITFDGVCAMARPLGQQRVRMLLQDHPDAPRPVFGGDRPGSKAIYSKVRVRAFLERIAEGGTPA